MTDRMRWDYEWHKLHEDRMTQRHILQWHILERRQNRQNYELREWHESLSQTLFEKFVQFVVLIIKFKAQCSKFKGKRVQSSKFKV